MGKSYTESMKGRRGKGKRKNNGRLKTRRGVDNTVGKKPRKAGWCSNITTMLI